jgi:hypothetical protein
MTDEDLVRFIYEKNSSNCEFGAMPCAGCLRVEDVVADEFFHRCGRCQDFFYCSKECQKEHRKLHKQSCKPLPETERAGMRNQDRLDQFARKYGPLLLELQGAMLYPLNFGSEGPHGWFTKIELVKVARAKGKSILGIQGYSFGRIDQAADPRFKRLLGQKGFRGITEYEAASARNQQPCLDFLFLGDQVLGSMVLAFKKQTQSDQMWFDFEMRPDIFNENHRKTIERIKQIVHDTATRARPELVEARKEGLKETLRKRSTA